MKLETTFGGAGVLTGDLSPECAAVVAAVLDALSAPRGADRASSTAVTTAAHSGVRSPVRTPAPPNVVSSFTARSSNRGASWSGTSGRDRASISAARAARS